MILATQTVDDFASADLLRTVVESCPTKLLLANPALDRRQYAELFQLNEMELDLLMGLIPRQQLLLKRPDLAKVLTLAVDPKSYWIYTNTPIDNDGSPPCFENTASRRAWTASWRLRESGRCRMPRCVVVLVVLLDVRWSAVSVGLGARPDDGIREVSASARSLITLQTRLRYTTMIVLPDGEEILDVICGDKDFWVITATQNIAHVKPAKEGAATNLNLVTTSGEVYSFLLTEKNGASMPDLKVYVNADPEAPKGKPKYYSAAQVEGLQGGTPGSAGRRRSGEQTRCGVGRELPAGVSGEAAVLVRLSQVREAFLCPIDLA